MESEPQLNVMVVVGSQHEKSATRAVLHEVAKDLQAAGCAVDVLDLFVERLPLFDPDSTYKSPYYEGLKKRAERADVFVLGTPDYHGSISSAMKNFLDHFWHEFAGKLFVTIVASHEKGLTVTDQLRTVARQCYAWAMPYGVSFTDKEDVQDGVVASEAFRLRLHMLLRDLMVYGRLLARQRQKDLECGDSCFMARHRKKSVSR